ncbi:MAG: DUF4340 domain-containing protein, partial [Planctomycetes bacterium]|nr:DUF4340 domain-containing protein [Planctomycetota bacterium]
KAEPVKIIDLISTVGGAEKQDFTADNVEDFAQYGLAEPAASIKFWSDKEEGTKTLLIGKAPDGDEPGNVYACVEGTSSVFTLKDDIVGKLSLRANDLRDTALAAVNPDNVIAVEIEHQGSTIALKKDGWDWKMLQPGEAAADTNAIEGLVKLIDEAKIIDWIDDPADLATYGLDKPVTITLKQKQNDGAEEEIQLLVGARDVGTCYAGLPGKPFVLKITARIADQANKGYLAFRSKRMLSFSRWASQNIDIARSSGTNFSAAKIGEARWAISKPVAGTADMANINNILWDLSSLDAEEIIAEKATDIALYGLDKPAITATVTVKAGEEDNEEKTHTVLIGAETKTSHYAKVDGRDAVFTVRGAVVGHLVSGLLSLNVITFEADDATALTIASGGKSFTCERKDKDADWQVTHPEASKIDNEKIKGLIKGLHLLRADRYQEYTPGDLAKYGLDKPAATIAVEVKDDQDKVLQIGNKLDNATAYARTADASPVFVLSKFDTHQMNRVLADFLGKESDKPENK